MKLILSLISALIVTYSCSPINNQHGYILEDFVNSSNSISQFNMETTTENDILQNVAFGLENNEIDIEKVKEVINSSQLESFVKNQKEGINYNVGERGISLSGGQRQRLGIARALYEDSKIIIFGFNRFTEASASASSKESPMLTSLAILLLGIILWTRFRSIRETMMVITCTALTIPITFGVASVSYTHLTLPTKRIV